MGRDGTGVRAASATSIEITFTYQGARCRERVQLKPTPANLKRAERHRAAILDAIERGTFDYAATFPDSPRAVQFAREPGAAITVGDWLERWFREIAPALKSSTRDTHARIVRHRLIPAVGHYTLAGLRWRDVRAWLEGEAIGTKTAANILSVLRSALQVAVDDDLIDTHPLAGHRLRKVPGPHPGDEIDPFSADERAAMLAAAEGQERNLIQFALWTGLRISELCALDWTDVDWRTSTLRVSRALTQAARESETPKTAAGRRDVRLLEPAMDALRAQRAHTELQGGAIFHNPRTNDRWPGDLTFRQGAWKRILRRAGVRYRYPYQMRHTYASMMLMAGEPAQWVATQMGHRDWTFTARTYARWIADDAPEAGSLAVERWGQAAGHAGINAGITDTNQPETATKKRR